MEGKSSSLLLDMFGKPDNEEKWELILQTFRSHKSKSDDLDIEEIFQTIPTKQHPKLWNDALSTTRNAMQILFPEKKEEGDLEDPGPNAESMEVDLLSPPSRPSKTPQRRKSDVPVDSTILDQAVLVLEAIAQFALIFIKDPQRKAPKPLLTLMTQLHDMLFQLEDFGMAALTLQRTTVQVCEAWYKGDRPGGQDLMPMTIPLLLRDTLEGEIKASNVKRVFALRPALLLFDMEGHHVETLKILLLRCFLSPLYLKVAEGRRFLAFIFGLHPLFIDEIHLAIKGQIPNARKSILKIYGDIYFRCWTKAQGPYLEKIESCLQDFMQHAVHASSQSLHTSLRVVLSSFHEQKEQKKGVDALLSKLYEPILWRSLRVANPVVRCQATNILADAFPIADYSKSNEEVDNILQRQFDFLQQLLVDDDPRVRVASISATARVLSGFWEVIPPETIRPLLSRLIGGLACDSSSALVRGSVAGALGTLIEEQPLAIPVLKNMLPMVAHLLHDKSEKVRLAFVELLQRVKAVKGIKFYHVAPVEQLLRRMALDSGSKPMTSALTSLLLNSYFPQGPDVRGSQQVSRCLHFLQQNKRAAVAFYSSIHEFISVGSGVKLAVMLSKCVFKAVELNEEDQAQISEEETTTKKKGGAGTARGIGSPPLKRIKEEGPDEEEEEEENHTQEADVPLASLKKACFDILEVLAVLVSSFCDQLQEKANKSALAMLLECYSENQLSAMYKYFEKDIKAREAVLNVAGLFSMDYFPGALENLLMEILTLSEDASISTYGPIVKLLVAWGEMPNLIGVIASSLSKALSQEDFEPAVQKNSKRKRGRHGSDTKKRGRRDGGPPELPPLLALRMLGSLLQLPGTGKDPGPLGKNLVKNSNSLDEIKVILEDGKAILDRVLASREGFEGVELQPALLVGCLEMLGRLYLHQEAARVYFPHNDKEERGEGEERNHEDPMCLPEQMRDLLAWATERVLPSISTYSDESLLEMDGVEGSTASSLFGSPLPMPPPRRRTRGKDSMSPPPPEKAEGKVPKGRPAEVQKLAQETFRRVLFLCSDWIACGVGLAEFSLRADIWGGRLLDLLLLSTEKSRLSMSVGQEEEESGEMNTSIESICSLLPALCRLVYQLSVQEPHGASIPASLWEILLKNANYRRELDDPDELLLTVKFGPTEVEKLIGSIISLYSRRKDLGKMVEDWIDFIFSQFDESNDDGYYSDFDPSIQFKSPTPDNVLTAILKSSDGTKHAVDAVLARLSHRDRLENSDLSISDVNVMAGLKLLSVLVEKAPTKIKALISAKQREFLSKMGQYSSSNPATPVATPKSLNLEDVDEKFASVVISPVGSL